MRRTWQLRTINLNSPRDLHVFLVDGSIIHEHRFRTVSCESETLPVIRGQQWRRSEGFGA
jgi:hypothetical protein